jgi:O-antigen ligase
MCEAGLFHDPNHLAVLAAITMVLCLNWIVDGSDKRPMDRRIHLLLSIAALALCRHGLLLTQSRGGFLAFIAVLAIFIMVRFEWKTSALLAAIVFSVIVALYSGRQTDLHMIRRTTSQMRLNFWVQGLRLFSQAPIFGIGQGNFLPRVGYQAHNSFCPMFC